MQYCNVEKAESEREDETKLRKLECVTSSMSSCSCAVQRDATRHDSVLLLLINFYVP